MKVTFYDLLGIDPNAANRDAAAAALWPNDVLSLHPGINTANDAPKIVQLLQKALVFTNVRPGVDPLVTLGSGAAGQITFAAEVHVTSNGLLTSTSQPSYFYLRSMPDLGIQLLPTDPDSPAQCFFALDGRGHEVLIERLPVQLFLKRGLAKTLSTAPEAVGVFQQGKVDGFAYTLQDDSQPSEIDAIVRFHLTPAGDVILEPSVPLSLGAARFMGLPAKAVYDLQLIPSPNRRDLLEWTRNDISSFVSNPPVKGAVGFRSIEIDFDQSPFQDLRQRIQGGAVNFDNLELVLEDVVLPLTVPILPIPSHGTFGFRRKISNRGDIVNAYSLTNAPVLIPIYGTPRQGGAGGTSLTISVEKLLIASGTPATVNFQASLVWQRASGNTIGATVGIDDDWTVFAGLVVGIPSVLQFTIAGTTVLLASLRLGVSVGRLTRGIAFKDSYEILADLAIQSVPKPPTTTGKIPAFQLKSLTGKKLDVVLRDLGWKFGRFSLDGLQVPEGVQLIFAGKVRIIVEEMGWVEEPNGAPYFSFSGGVALGFGGGDSVKPSGDPGDDQGEGVGLRVRRLRFRTNDDASQPPLKLDGLFLNLHYGTVWIQGFGYITADETGGWAIDEWGFGVKVQFSATEMTFNLAAEFIKGGRHEIANPANAFDYFLASLALSYLPAGPYALYDLRLLLAENMAPSLGGAFPDGEGMALLQWHQGHDSALTLPSNRNLADWLAEEDALSFGVGCGFSLNSCGKAMKLDLFIFFAKSKADTGLLIVGDLFILKDPKPIAFVAVEYDVAKEKFGVMIGVDLTLADFTSGAAPSWLAASLTGTLYFGNQPWSFAIGQLADQRSWLSIHASWNAWLLQASFQLGVCIQVVDGGPKGFGVLFTASASADWGIGSFVLFGSFGFIVGTWKTGSDTAGAEAWLGFGFKINLFFVFSFGADISVRLIYLHGHSWYVTASAEIRIDTPWFLPNVTFRIDKTWSEPQAFKTSTLTASLASASALEPGSAAATDLLVPALSDGHRDPQLLYTFNQLTGISGVRIPDTRASDLPIVSTDATIAIDLAQPLANDSAIATGTYDGTTDLGVQRVQDLKLRYGLRSIGVRRSPRFGPTAGTWSDLVKESDTAFAIGGAAPQTLTFAWDADARADGRLSPQRLLVNSESPYSFAGAAARNDEEAVRNDPGYPCCSESRVSQLEAKSHRLDFADLALGSRAPAAEQFSGNGAWWHWVLRPAPVIGPGAPSFAGSRVARFFPDAPALVGLVDLAEPAAAANLRVAWDPCFLQVNVPLETASGLSTVPPLSLPVRLFFEGYGGLDLAAQQSVPLASSGSATLSLQAGLASQGLTRLVLRVELDSTHFVPVAQPVIPPPAAAPPPAGPPAAPPPAGQPFSVTQPAITILEIDYVGLRDTLAAQAGAQQCKNAGTLGPPSSDAKGKLGFLPNHDYEVVVTTAIELSTAAQGARALQLSEPFYFRTKGLPGLNAAPNTGDDLRRHVETTYPPLRAIPLYRQEPIALAFAEGMSSVLPIDRAPASGAPPERAQMFPLLLNVDRVASLDGLQRLTVPSDDWIAAHRSSPPPLTRFPAEPGFAKALVRHAASLDPLVLRNEAVRLAFPQCAPPQIEHASQVLLHEPIDPAGKPGAWQAQTGFRATVRQKDGPFTERTAFDAFDLGAFAWQADGAAPAQPWSADGAGNLVAPAAGAGRQYAACGEPGWDHLQVQSQIDLRGGAAGIAVGVGAGTPVPQAILATVEADGGGHALVLRRRDGAGENELARAGVAVGGPLLLSVVAFDDNVRATVGDVVVEAPRGAVREGRVALVASGPAAFAGIRVDGLDMYTFDFQTSRYLSFQDHVGSYDGRLGVLASGAFGGAPATLAGVLAAHGAAIGPLMTPAADPQERQQLFATMAAALGIGVRPSPASLAVSRLTDASGTYGLLVESCEPLPLTRDVFIGLIRHGTGPAPLVPPTGPPPSAAPRAGGPGGGSSDVSLGLTPLTNGDETIALLLPQGGTPLPSGRYALRCVLNRPRWRASGAADPEQVYTQISTLELQW